ncbi:MAG: FAD-binding protein [Desulfobacteraceae bacterium]|nr:MAG: FAD-binding protein [Desulfobacteraceae bacterium]
MAQLTFHTLHCDVLVIGGGGAAIRAAIACREKGADALVVSKTRVGFGNNTYISKATWAVPGVGHPEDTNRVYENDTLVAGCFMNDRKMVERVARGASGVIPFFERCGVPFATRDGRMVIDQAPGHTYPRHVRGKNRKGSDLMLPLRAYAERIGVRFLERVFVTRLVKNGNRVAAATGLSEDGIFYEIGFQSAILATGGYGRIYLRTNNASGIQGDGQAIAFRLGLPLKDMEFVQFYPTATGRGGTRLLLYEVLICREGARLKNGSGEDILIKHGLEDPLGLTRDRLARTIMEEVRSGLGIEGGVIMDLRSLTEQSAATVSPLLPSGWSPSIRELVVAPTAHFCMGGVVVDSDAQTGIPGLFCAGEVCAGVHGANRLAGNALLEIFVMGEAAGINAAQSAREMDPATADENEIREEKKRIESMFSGTGKDARELCRTLQSVMWDMGGVIRDGKGLQEALTRIEELRALGRTCMAENAIQLTRRLDLENMLLVSEMVCRAALCRIESRGAHYRTDCPQEKNPEWLRNVHIRKGRGESMVMETVPVSH